MLETHSFLMNKVYFLLLKRDGLYCVEILKLRFSSGDSQIEIRYLNPQEGENTRQTR